MFDTKALISAAYLPFVNAARNCPMTQYEFLALCQGTKFAVTPVHTEQEKHLFTSLIGQYIHDSDNGKTIPDWKIMNKQWSSKANGFTIFYKSTELLKSYYNFVEGRSIAKTCIHANYETIKKIWSVVSSDNRPSVIVPEANDYQDLHDSNTAYALRVVDNNPELSQPTLSAVITPAAT